MQPERRVFRWREIARITLTQFEGDLNRILVLPYAAAAKALKQFPAAIQLTLLRLTCYCVSTVRRFARPLSRCAKNAQRPERRSVRLRRRNGAGLPQLFVVAIEEIEGWFVRHRDHVDFVLIETHRHIVFGLIRRPLR